MTKTEKENYLMMMFKGKVDVPEGLRDWNGENNLLVWKWSVEHIVHSYDHALLAL